ncbi:ribonuclease H2 subunit A [Coniosporium apollinis CBS 100218]|uniref:Ribonuclease n=1 Tax=Coniosporium apollinis (strain CBS 100218) TaxID=1168221 RepID=R7YJJ7_CONA1|nr:ribonuclease H2 subunit A [Coniosporium apollinis CBS 100218]EON61821.1 ribonuclease H2 subunit A [Coniosporium apollinis CBS 100218]
MDGVEEMTLDSQDIAQETPASDVFKAPSIHTPSLLAGASYTHYSPIPSLLANNTSTECVLGVDEAGRGPVLGPMVYALFYLPLPSERPLLADTHHFDDSKVLTPAVRSSLMEKLCTPGSDLHQTCGWATRVISARDISSAMLSAVPYNLNAQAMDATVDLIKGVFARGVNVKEIYIDTIGQPAAYQKKLERIFPAIKITVAKKADSLYPCVSAASVCAKVTRDAALEVCYESYSEGDVAAEGWGSGYPSDARCTTWLKKNMDPVFGWGNECRFSWGTAKELLEAKGGSLKVEWPVEGDDEGMKMTDFFAAAQEEEDGDELSNWYGSRVTAEVF